MKAQADMRLSLPDCLRPFAAILKNNCLQCLYSKKYRQDNLRVLDLEAKWFKKSEKEDAK